MTVPRTAILLAAALLGVAGPAIPQGPGAPAAGPPGGERLPETPREYQGAAQPLDSRDTAGAVSRARVELQAGEWGRGFASLDEVLEKVISAKRARKASPTAPAQAAAGMAAQLAEVNIMGVVPAGGGAAAPAQELEIEPGEEVLSLDGIRFLPVTAAIRALLLDVSPEGRAVYESTYGAPAREALEKARALDPSKGASELRRVAERWPITAAAAAARDLHAARLLASGRPQEAARALEARLELPASPAESAAALVHLAMAWELAGAPASANRALERLLREQPEASILVRGEEVAARDLSGHDLFRTLRERAKAPGSEGAAWASDGGSFHHAGAPIALERMPPLGSQAAWIHPPPVPGARSGNGNEMRIVPQAAGLPRQAVSLGRSIFLRSGTDVLALDAWTGKTLWQASPSDLPGGMVVQQGRQLIRLGRVRQYSDSGAPASLSLALVPPRGSRQALVVGIDRPPAVEQEPSGAVRYRRNALVAYSAGTGKLVWEAELPSGPSAEDDETKGLAFLGPPVAVGEILVAPASGGEALHAVGLTSRGKVLWKRRLFAWSLQAQGVFLAPGPSFAAGEGAVGIAGGHGLACAIDASTGEVLWTSRYRSGLRSENRVVHFHPGTRPSPPIIVPASDEPLLIAAPPDTDTVTAFRLRTGSIRWERSPGKSGASLIGAAGGMALAGTDRVHALDLEDGKQLWESDVLGGQVLTGVVGEGFITVHAAGGHVARLDPSTGKVLAKLRILDPRLPAFEPLQLIAAGRAGEPARLIGIGPGVAFAVEPQDASWVEIGGDAGPSGQAGAGDRRLFERARLLRAESRHAEALQVLERLHAGLGTDEMKDRVKADIIAVSRAAAEAQEDPAYIEKLLEKNIVDTPRGRTDLRLLQAHIIEKRFAREGDARILEDAACIYLELARKESLVASAPGGLLVDAATYASEALREIRPKLLSDEARQRAADPRAEESARGALQGKPDRRVLSRLSIRRAHLEASVEAARRLVASIPDPDEAAEAARFLLASFPALSEDPAVASAAAHRVPAPVADTAAAGLAAVLAARRGKPLISRFVVSSEDAFMASTAPGSLPLPVLVAIAGTDIRLYDADGRIVLERPLPGYPDVADVKLHLSSGAEEPAEAHLAEDGLVLFSAAGLYAFRGVEKGGARSKEFRLAWMQEWPHPLASKASFVRMGWHGGMPGGDLFTAPAWTASGMPLVLSDDWTLSGFDRRTGKHRFRIARGETTGRLGAPAAARVRGDRVEALARSPAGIAVYTLPADGAGGRARPARAFGADGAQAQAQGQAGSAALAAGGLVSLFQGPGLSAVETASGIRLWSKEGAAAMIAFTTSDAVWLSEPDGKLVARSLVTGREKASVELPARGVVVDCIEERDGGGRVAVRWLLVSRDGFSRIHMHPGHVPDRTGTDLYLVKLDAGGKKLSELLLHEGAVAYTGCRLAIEPGRALILWNGEAKEGKWYTRAVEAGPGGVSEVLSFEISGKGTGQSPRVAVLDGGLAVGNAGGFSWFAPAGEEPRGTDGEPGTKKTDG